MLIQRVCVPGGVKDKSTYVIGHFCLRGDSLLLAAALFTILVLAWPWPLSEPPKVGCPLVIGGSIFYLNCSNFSFTLKYRSHLKYCLVLLYPWPSLPVVVVLLLCFSFSSSSFISSQISIPCLLSLLSLPAFVPLSNRGRAFLLMLLAHSRLPTVCYDDHTDTHARLSITLLFPLLMIIQEMSIISTGYMDKCCNWTLIGANKNVDT